MNPFTDLIPAQVRKYLYAAYFVIGVVLGALSLLGKDVGDWLTVYAYVGTALGLVAASNTNPPEEG